MALVELPVAKNHRVKNRQSPWFIAHFCVLLGYEEFSYSQQDISLLCCRLQQLPKLKSCHLFIDTLEYTHAFQCHLLKHNMFSYLFISLQKRQVLLPVYRSPFSHLFFLFIQCFWTQLRPLVSCRRPLWREKNSVETRQISETRGSV